jgi:hypothetical protein
LIVIKTATITKHKRLLRNTAFSIVRLWELPYTANTNTNTNMTPQSTIPGSIQYHNYVTRRSNEASNCGGRNKEMKLANLAPSALTRPYGVLLTLDQFAGCWVGHVDRLMPNVVLSASRPAKSSVEFKEVGLVFCKLELYLTKLVWSPQISYISYFLYENSKSQLD